MKIKEHIDELLGNGFGTYQSVFGCGGTRICYSSDDLNEHYNLADYFTSLEPSREVSRLFTVRSVFCEGLFDRMQKALRDLGGDYCTRYCDKARRATRARVVVEDTDIGVHAERVIHFVLADWSQVWLLRRKPVYKTDYTPMRSIRSLMKLSCLAEKWIPFHGSSCAIGNKGIMFIGDKMSGKTHSMLLCLTRKFSFVANDTTFVRDVDGTIAICSLPCKIGIRPETFAQFAEIEDFAKSNRSYFKAENLLNLSRKRTGEPGDYDLYMTSQELAGLFSVDCVTKCDLNTVFFLTNGTEDEAAQAEAINEKIAKNVLSIGDDERKLYYEFFELDDSEADARAGLLCASLSNCTRVLDRSRLPAVLDLLT